MPTDGFAAQLRAGDPLVGAWSNVGDPVVAEVLAGEGFDFVVADGEHSENTMGDLATVIRGMDAAGTDTAPVVRASGADRAEIRRLLDLGPSGIVIPQIESAAEAREAVAATQYPPEGVRGVAGGRASGYGTALQAYVDTADRTIATILQVETRGAVAEIETIAGIDGLDALFVGPADLSARLGAFGDVESHDFQDAIDTVVDAAHDASVPIGTIATSPETVASRFEDWGIDFIVAGNVVEYIRQGATTFRRRLEAE